ncbi:MAG TPA: sigma-54-dependent Fis family transcriptional regulator, partial [Cupriavidus sp.]|nr:sigma-54-dependent Fis family transcriptional regulator [Cupriavidus sp.]
MQDGLRVLFVEDEPLVRQATAQSLELAGFSVLALPSAEAAMPHLGADFPGVLVTDVRLSGASGLDLLQHCRNAAPGVPVILVTGHGDITMAVQAMREGAYDFIEKPFGADRLTETVRRALERRALELENHALRRELAGPAAGTRIIGRSPAIAQVRDLIANVAATDVPVMINGETGTGKELVARSLHALSTRRDQPFIALNCGAVPESIFESEMF